jgi:hypothetical protein
MVGITPSRSGPDSGSRAAAAVSATASSAARAARARATSSSPRGVKTGRLVGAPRSRIALSSARSSAISPAERVDLRDRAGRGRAAEMAVVGQRGQVAKLLGTREKHRFLRSFVLPLFTGTNIRPDPGFPHPAHFDGEHCPSGPLGRRAARQEEVRMFLRIDRLQIDMPLPKEPDPIAAAAVQELMGGRFGEMTTLNTYMFQSFNFRAREKLRPFYALIANIATEELGHIELVGAAVNGLLNGAEPKGRTEDGDASSRTSSLPAGRG